MQSMWIFVETNDCAATNPLPQVCASHVNASMNFMYCKPRPSDWTYSVVGYHSSLLSWKPGFESWYVRHQSGVRTDA